MRRYLVGRREIIEREFWGVTLSGEARLESPVPAEPHPTAPRLPARGLASNRIRIRARPRFAASPDRRDSQTGQLTQGKPSGKLRAESSCRFGAQNHPKQPLAYARLLHSQKQSFSNFVIDHLSYRAYQTLPSLPMTSRGTYENHLQAPSWLPCAGMSVRIGEPEGGFGVQATKTRPSFVNGDFTQEASR
jgi:hypothetical protein